MRWVGLVRSVMLGRDGLDRQGLLDAVERAGGSEARSHLTTGNITFDAAMTDVDEVAGRLEHELTRVVGRATLVAVRSLAWLRKLTASDVFSGWDPETWELEIAFLRHSAPAIARPAFEETGRTHVIQVYDREVATARPRSGPRRPHVNRLLEEATGHPATARGWSTLCRLAAETSHPPT